MKTNFVITAIRVLLGMVALPLAPWVHSESIQCRESVEFNVDTLKKLEGKHDLSLSDWGPYSKSYIGLSHITDKQAGIRFDLSVFPAFYRRKVSLPNVRFENNFHPWKAASDLSYFSFRHELEWKDKVYADIAYAKIEGGRLIHSKLVNNSDLPQSLALHFLASTHFPSIKPYSPDTPLQMEKVSLGKNAIWLDALDYQSLQYAKPRHDNNLVYDGWRRGEVRRHGFVDGKGVGGVGRDSGDRLSYRLELASVVHNAVLSIRYRSKDSSHFNVSINGARPSKVELKPGDSQLMHIELGRLNSGSHKFELIAESGKSVEFDGFVIGPKKSLEQLKFSKHQWQYPPELIETPEQNSVLIKYANSPTYYGIKWFAKGAVFREFHQGKLEGFFEHKTNEHNGRVFVGDKQGHHSNVFIRPINIEKHTSQELYAVVSSGTRQSVSDFLNGADAKLGSYKKTLQARASCTDSATTIAAGKKYQFGQQISTSTLLSNVVFPVYTQGQYIRHGTPGRWWDSLYTWDAGFIGIGLASLDMQRSIETLNTYLTSRDSQSAFIHHGTPLPVQHYQFLEIWNRTQSKPLLEFFYPKLRRYYLFLAGHHASSTTRTLNSGLLKTWDYFYNSGGWDDYPPQHYVHKNKLQNSVAPVVATAHAIRVAKILRMAAQALNKDKHVNQYQTDIDSFSEALQKYSWDEESGYFGYVRHNKKGWPVGILRTAEGENLNKGLGGLSPLIAGITTPQQRQTMLAHLSNRNEIFSEIGLSAVDQTASYYRDDGYWNGTVWMPHQWFYWKTLLDLGEHELAHDIAKTALDLWKQETEASYNSFEHFVIDSGRGAGWHQFGALSAPVVDWFSAYFKPGSITGGYNIWLKNKRFNNDNTELEVELNHYADQPLGNFSLLVVMNAEYQYQANWNGRPIVMTEQYPGSYSVQIPATDQQGMLSIGKRL